MNTQSSHAQNPGQAHTETQPGNKHHFGLPSPLKAYPMLFKAGLNNLDNEELDYLAGLNDAAIEETHTLSDVLMAMGGLIAHSEDEPSKEQMAGIAWGLSNHLQHITAMLHIACEARFYLAERGQNPPA